MTTATRTSTRTRKNPQRPARRTDLHALSDRRFYTLLAYRLSVAILATIVVLTLGR